MVKRLRRRPLTAKTGVRVPVGLPLSDPTFSSWVFCRDGGAVERARLEIVFTPIRVTRVQIPFSAPRATAFEPDGKGIAIHFHKWSCGRCRGKTIQAEKLRAQLQCSRSGRQVCQKAVMRKRAAEKTVALFRCPTHPVPPVRLKRRRFFVIVYRY